MKAVAQQRLKTNFKLRVHDWAAKLDVRITRLTVRAMRSKWASCSTDGRLTFNSDLLPLAEDLWDYVIVHELLHFFAPNHGKLWKSLMRAHLGDWEQTSRRLQEFQAIPTTQGGSGDN